MGGERKVFSFGLSSGLVKAKSRVRESITTSALPFAGRSCLLGLRGGGKPYLPFEG